MNVPAGTNALYENAAAAFSYNAFVPAGTFINEHTCIIHVTTIMDMSHSCIIPVELSTIKDYTTMLTYHY